MKKKIVLISTGGTIEKTYSELEGILHNEYHVLDVILEKLVLEGIDITRVSLMNKDSLNLTAEDLSLIEETISKLVSDGSFDGIVVVHGTDRLSVTGENLHSYFSKEELKIPIVLTGAMRPFMLRNTDAIQNLTEALLAVQILEGGVYVAMHNQVLKFPGIKKNRSRARFEKNDS